MTTWCTKYLPFASRQFWAFDLLARKPEVLTRMQGFRDSVRIASDVLATCTAEWVGSILLHNSQMAWCSFSETYLTSIVWMVRAVGRISKEFKTLSVLHTVQWMMGFPKMHVLLEKVCDEWQVVYIKLSAICKVSSDKSKRGCCVVRRWYLVITYTVPLLVREAMEAMWVCHFLHLRDTRISPVWTQILNLHIVPASMCRCIDAFRFCFMSCINARDACLLAFFVASAFFSLWMSSLDVFLLFSPQYSFYCLLPFQHRCSLTRVGDEEGTPGAVDELNEQERQ